MRILVYLFAKSYANRISQFFLKINFPRLNSPSGILLRRSYADILGKYFFEPILITLASFLAIYHRPFLSVEAYLPI